jgi:hypothetical protein
MKQRFLSNRLLPLIFISATLFGGFLFLVPAAHASTVYASGTITNSTTWVKTNVYVIQNTLQIGSGGKLTINSSTVVKFGTSATL